MNTYDLNDGNGSHVFWCVAVIASREQPSELLATIQTVLDSANENTMVDILVNGNPALVPAIVELITQLVRTNESPVLRVWEITLGDKANTWNQYLHKIWPGNGTGFFVDGYCRLSPNALRLLDDGMAAAPNVLAGTSVPTVGRSATQWRNAVLKNGELVGGFFAFKKSVMQELREKGFNLPLGLYGYDGALGAVIAFGLDPSKHQWRPKERIFAHPDVTWVSTEKKWWRASDVKGHISRTLKAALRVLVGQAFRDFFEVRRLPPEKLPRTTEELVLNWAASNPGEAKKVLWRAPLSYFALKKLRKPKNWSDASKPPMLAYSSDPLYVQTPSDQIS